MPHAATQAAPAADRTFDADHPLRYGLIGAGGFGRFCVQQYRQMDNVAPVAVADVNADAARKFADDLNVEMEADVESLLKRDDIDLVHIATPPFTHAELVHRALDAGKHVLCEKPLAVSRDDAESMIARAKEKQRLLAVNLIMRYDPLTLAVKKLIDASLLGEPLFGGFDNLAQDEGLPDSHWFWDREKSGGIFVEHGVHFFDLLDWWLCADEDHGRVVGAQLTSRSARDGRAGLVDQYHAAVRYQRRGGDSAVVFHFHHAFTQPERLDRQELRLHFQHGTVRLFEWVPARIEIDATVDAPTLTKLQALLPDPQTQTLATYQNGGRHMRARHEPHEADGRYRICSTAGMGKQALYGHVVRALLADQIEKLNRPDHRRRVGEGNGLTSLRTALDADALARGD